MEYAKNQYKLHPQTAIDKEVLLTLENEELDFLQWIKEQRSFSSYKSEKCYIKHGIGENMPCILSTIKDYNGYKLWVLFDNATSEWYRINQSEIVKEKRSRKKTSSLSKINGKVNSNEC